MIPACTAVSDNSPGPSSLLGLLLLFLLRNLCCTQLLLLLPVLRHASLIICLQLLCHLHSLACLTAECALALQHGSCHQALDLRGLLLLASLTSHNILLYIILLFKSEQLADVCSTLWTEAARLVVVSEAWYI